MPRDVPIDGQPAEVCASYHKYNNWFVDPDKKVPTLCFYATPGAVTADRMARATSTGHLEEPLDCFGQLRRIRFRVSAHPIDSQLCGAAFTVRHATGSRVFVRLASGVF